MELTELLTKKNRLDPKAKAVAGMMYRGHLFAVWLYLEDWQIERGVKVPRKVK